MAERKELERIDRENRLAARGARQLNAAGQARYNQIRSGPQNVVRDTQALGIGIGLSAGRRLPPLSGLSHLSGMMTEAGGQLLGHMWRKQVTELDAALGKFNANNPRPTESQREQYYNKKGELLYTFVTANTRAHAVDPSLTIPAKSAVVGSYAGAITQLVRMRNAGEINEPIAALGTLAATVLAVRAYEDAKERAALNVGRPTGQVSQQDLRAQRNAVFGPVQQVRAAEYRRARQLAEKRKRDRDAALAAQKRARDLKAQDERRRQQARLDFERWERDQVRLAREQKKRRDRNQRTLQTIIGIGNAVVESRRKRSNGSSSRRNCGQQSCAIE